MHWLRSSRNKLILACILALLVALGGSATGLSLSAVAQGLLVLSLAAAAWVLLKSRVVGRPPSLPDRLQLIGRLGLAPRCGAVLVEVDGRTLLIVHGDGFATVRSIGSSFDGSPVEGT